MKVQQFALCAQVSCEIACMTDEQREEFMKEVPMFMKHCPHLHVMQKQMARQREMMAQRQAAMEQGGHVHAGHGPPMVGSDPESAKMMQDMMSDPESKEMMEKLSMRMNTTMQGVQKKVTSWAAAEKQSYWEGASQDPLLERLSACGPDVKKRLEMFRDLSDEEIERVMTIQFLMISHMQMGGRAGSEDAAQKSSSGSDGGVLGGLTKMLSGLSTGGSAPGGVGAAGGSGHTHTASCQHGTLPTAARAPDVTSGKLESMDR